MPELPNVEEEPLFKLEGRTCPKCDGLGIVPDGMEFGVLRRALGVSQEEMATAMGVSTSFVSSLEHNNRTFNDEHLNTYIDILEQASLAQLMHKAENNPTEIIPDQ